jgi:hypothetical protein
MLLLVCGGIMAILDLLERIAGHFVEANDRRARVKRHRRLEQHVPRTWPLVYPPPPEAPPTDETAAAAAAEVQSTKYEVQSTAR